MNGQIGWRGHLATVIVRGNPLTRWIRPVSVCLIDCTEHNRYCGLDCSRSSGHIVHHGHGTGRHHQLGPGLAAGGADRQHVDVHSGLHDLLVCDHQVGIGGWACIGLLVLVLPQIVLDQLWNIAQEAQVGRVE